MILWELIGVTIILTIALIVCIKVVIEEAREEIADYKRRNHWKKRYRKRR